MPTEVLLWLSNTVRQWGLVILGGIVVAVVVVRRRLKSESGRRFLDSIKLRSPIVGPIWKSLAVSRFCRVLGTLLRNGVPILKSLEISRHAANNRILSEAIAEASEKGTTKRP